MSLSREKYENIMRTTVFFELFFSKVFFCHCILITSKKNNKYMYCTFMKANNQRFRSIKSRANCWRVRKPPASRVKNPLSGRFPFRISQLYATDLYTLKVKAKFLRYLPFNICRSIGATWQVVTPIWPPRATSGFIFWM